MWTYIWLGITVLALVVEFATAEMVTIWFVGGGLVSMILALVGLEWYIHLPVFIVLSFVLMIMFRKIVIKYFTKDEEKTNADSAFGKEYTLLSSVEPEKYGTIKINGIEWNVTTQVPQTIKKGEKVKIVEIKGNKYIVEKI